MTSAHKMIFPGMIIGCLFLVLATSWIAVPHIALSASADESPTNVHVAGQGDLSAQAVPTAAPTSVPAETQTIEAAAISQPQPAAEQTDSSPPVTGGCSVSLKFPDSIRQWCDLIDHYAQQNQLDPNLVAAVMLQESGGNPSAYSKSGAVGLMQVMPRDGLAAGFMCVAGPCFSARPSMDELYDPEFNISYGTKMLAGLIQKHGDLREALRKYGPMNMGYRYADIVLAIQARYR